MAALQGKIAIVTGGASGIGRAIALRLARDGADVAVFDLDAKGSETVAGEIRGLGRRALAARVDVASADDVSKAVAQVRETLGAVSVLVNNAGHAAITPLVDMTEEQWDRMLDVHVKGAFLCSRAVLPGMIAAGFGRIVNVASVAGLEGEAHLVHYSAAKAGIIGFSKALAREVGAAGITVNAIAPGLIDTPILGTLGVPPAALEEFKKSLMVRTPVGRVGQPDDIAAAAAYLASLEAGFMTGQVVSPNGGLYM